MIMKKSETILKMLYVLNQCCVLLTQMRRKNKEKFYFIEIETKILKILLIFQSHLIEVLDWIKKN